MQIESRRTKLKHARVWRKTMEKFHNGTLGPIIVQRKESSARDGRGLVGLVIVWGGRGRGVGRREMRGRGRGRGGIRWRRLECPRSTNDLATSLPFTASLQVVSPERATRARVKTISFSCEDWRAILIGRVKLWGFGGEKRWWYWELTLGVAPPGGGLRNWFKGSRVGNFRKIDLSSTIVSTSILEIPIRCQQIRTRYKSNSPTVLNSEVLKNNGNCREKDFARVKSYVA